MANTSGRNQTYLAFKKDIVCGSFAGAVCCITGHPLDSMKVRMQNAKPRVGFREICKRTLKQEGIKGFYKGIGPPMITVPLINSVVFASYEFCKRMLGVKSEDDFTVTQSMVSGMFAGFVNSLVLTPVELVKCRL